MTKRQTDGRVKDVIGYQQKSAEVIVGGIRAVVGGGLTNVEGLNVGINPQQAGGEGNRNLLCGDNSRTT